MFIGVTGDTHNNLKNIKNICTIFNKNGADLVFHTGDITLPKSLLAFKDLNCPLIAVLGNNDLEEKLALKDASKQFDCKIFDEPYLLSIQSKKVCVIHHPELIDDNLIDQSDIILHGHTHRFRKEIIKNTLIFNPGECAGLMKDKNQVGMINLSNSKTRIFTF